MPNLTYSIPSNSIGRTYAGKLRALGISASEISFVRDAIDRIYSIPGLDAKILEWGLFTGSQAQSLIKVKGTLGASWTAGAGINSISFQTALGFTNSGQSNDVTRNLSIADVSTLGLTWSNIYIGRMNAGGVDTTQSGLSIFLHGKVGTPGRIQGSYDQFDWSTAIAPAGGVIENSTQMAINGVSRRGGAGPGYLSIKPAVDTERIKAATYNMDVVANGFVQARHSLFGATALPTGTLDGTFYLGKHPLHTTGGAHALRSVILGKGINRDEDSLLSDICFTLDGFYNGYTQGCLCIGDSLTNAQGISLASGFASRIAAFLGVPRIDASITGQQVQFPVSVDSNTASMWYRDSADLMRRSFAQIPPERFKHVIIALGYNDKLLAVSGTREREFAEQYEQIIRLVLTAGIPARDISCMSMTYTVVPTDPNQKTANSTYSTEIRKLCAQYDISFWDAYTGSRANGDNGTTFTGNSDGIHFGITGHTNVFQAWHSRSVPVLDDVVFSAPYP